MISEIVFWVVSVWKCLVSTWGPCWLCSDCTSLYQCWLGQVEHGRDDGDDHDDGDGDANGDGDDGDDGDDDDGDGDDGDDDDGDDDDGDGDVLMTVHTQGIMLQMNHFSFNTRAHSNYIL